MKRTPGFIVSLVQYLQTDGPMEGVS